MRDDRELVVLGRPPSVGPRRGDADDRELVGADPDDLADRVAVLEQRLVGRLAEDDDVPAVQHFVVGEEPALGHLEEVDLDQFAFAPMMAIDCVRCPRSTIRCWPVTLAAAAFRRGDLVLQHAGVFDRQVRPLHQSCASMPDRSWQAHPRDEDRVRTEFANQVPERVVEPTDERSHATIEVMPITTPRTVSTDRSLLARSVPAPSQASRRTVHAYHACIHGSIPACSASIGSSLAALIAG